jgi:nucleotide-binding universal stress UspA family protein
MTATTARAEFLKTEERFAVAENSTIAARWGEDAADTRQSSPLATQAAAEAEAARQLAQLAAVRARDLVVVEGLHPGLEGQTVRIWYGGQFGMTTEADLLVIRARVRRNTGQTELEGEVLL